MTRKEFETRLFDKVRENERIVNNVKGLRGHADVSPFDFAKAFRAEGFNDGIEFVLELLGEVDD